MYPLSPVYHPHYPKEQMLGTGIVVGAIGCNRDFFPNSDCHTSAIAVGLEQCAFVAEVSYETLFCYKNIAL